MINGWTSRIQIVGAILILLYCAYSIVDLAKTDRGVPVELAAIAAGAAGFLYGVTNKFPAGGDAVRDVLTGKKATGNAPGEDQVKE